MRKLLKLLFVPGKTLPEQIWCETPRLHGQPRPLRRVTGIVVVVSQFGNNELVSADFLATLQDNVTGLADYFCMTVLPLPCYFKPLSDDSLDAEVHALRSVLFQRRMRIVATCGLLEMGSLGSIERLAFGAIGEPVTRAFRAAMNFGNESSWCDERMADIMALGPREAQTSGGEVLIRIPNGS